MLTLQAAADELGVHYMTAYRYVRTGRLTAIKERGQWWVKPGDLAALARPGATDRPGVAAASDNGKPGETRVRGAASRARYAELLQARAIEGDDAGSWQIITEALSRCASPAEIHTDVIGPAIEQIGEAWADGSLSVAAEHRATAVIQRILGRLTPQFRHPGRYRSTVVLGLVAGDTHALPTAILADLLTDLHFNVIDLGANTPDAAFVQTASAVDGAVAIGLCGITDGQDHVMVETIATLARELPGVPVYLGGPVGLRVGPTANVAGWARTGPEAIELFEAFDESRR